jgi:flagellar hook-associated protein 3 FlgL
LLEQSDGNAIHRPSDNPVQCVRTMAFKTSLEENNQYTQNLDDAISWMKQSDNALVNMTDLLKTIKEKVSQAANSINTDSDFVAISKEVEETLNQIRSLSNSQIGDRYVFSGQKDKTMPYSENLTTVTSADVKTVDRTQLTTAQLTNIGAPTSRADQFIVVKDATNNTRYVNTDNGNILDQDFNVVDTVNGFSPTWTSMTFQSNGVPNSATITDNGGNTYTIQTSSKQVATYNGDDNKISMVIKPGEVNSANDSVNLTGSDIFGDNIFGGKGTSLIDDLMVIKDKIKAGDVAWLSDDGMTLAGKLHDQVVNAQVETSTRQASYQMAKTMMESKNTTIKDDINTASAANIPKLITDMQMAETVYRLSLSVGSKIIPPSLADYL